MSEITRVIRLKANGRSDSGLGPWGDITQANIVSGEARERSEEFVNKLMPQGCLRAGVWEAKAYTEKLVDYPCDEFMVVLEGSCTIVEEDGNREAFSQGDCFFLPRGFNGYWEQQETMKKYYMIVADN